MTQRRLEKIKKSIRAEEKKGEKEGHGAKLFSFLTGEGSLKERTEAMEDLLFKIQVNKNKPEFESSMKAVFPTLLKMLKDTNPKIVSLTLRILEQCIEWVAGSESQLSTLVSVIVEKLGDQKISIRQNVSKVIRDLAVTPPLFRTRPAKECGFANSWTTSGRTPAPSSRTKLSTWSTTSTSTVPKRRKSATRQPKSSTRSPTTPTTPRPRSRLGRWIACP